MSRITRVEIRIFIIVFFERVLKREIVILSFKHLKYRLINFACSTTWNADYLQHYIAHYRNALNTRKPTPKDSIYRFVNVCSSTRHLLFSTNLPSLHHPYHCHPVLSPSIIVLLHVTNAYRKHSFAFIISLRRLHPCALPFLSSPVYSRRGTVWSICTGLRVDSIPFLKD